VPVLLVKRERSTRYSTVVLAVDASRRSFQAARRGIAVAPTARHVLVHGTAVLGENMLLLRGAGDEALHELRDGQLAVVRPEIERLAEELTPPPDEVVVEPTRAQALISTLAALRGADLLVVGAERRGLRHAFMGSVSRQAMESAPCDVLVVPLEREA
jgi:nucleotide-binding universal stress UspA family protein